MALAMGMWSTCIWTWATIICTLNLQKIESPKPWKLKVPHFKKTMSQAIASKSKMDDELMSSKTLPLMILKWSQMTGKNHMLVMNQMLKGMVTHPKSHCLTTFTLLNHVSLHLIQPLHLSLV